MVGALPCTSGVNYGYKRAESHNFAVKSGEDCGAVRRAMNAPRLKLHFANYNRNSIVSGRDLNRRKMGKKWRLKNSSTEVMKRGVTDSRYARRAKF